MKIHVTKNHINTGIKNDPEGCMVYKALEDANNDVVYVLYNSISFGNGDHLLIGPKLKKKIEQFDDDKKLKPFTFRVTEQLVEIV